jgi:hypothetical protein
MADPGWATTLSYRIESYRIGRQCPANRVRGQRDDANSGSQRKHRDGVLPRMGPVAAAKKQRLPHDTPTLRDRPAI